MPASTFSVQRPAGSLGLRPLRAGRLGPTPLSPSGRATSPGLSAGFKSERSERDIRAEVDLSSQHSERLPDSTPVPDAGDAAALSLPTSAPVVEAEGTIYSPSGPTMKPVGAAEEVPVFIERRGLEFESEQESDAAERCAGGRWTHMLSMFHAAPL